MKRRSGVDCNGSSGATNGAGLRRPAFVAALLLTIVAGLAAPGLAEARITRIQITRVESPTFEGASFGAVGQYEKLVGRAYGEVDPADPKRRDHRRHRSGAEERRRHGRVLDGHLHPEAGRPVAGQPPRALRREQPGRQVRVALPQRQPRQLSPPPNDPTTAADAGNGFLMRQGYTIVSSGWDATVSTGEQPPHDDRPGRAQSGRLLDRRPRARGVRRSTTARRRRGLSPTRRRAWTSRWPASPCASITRTRRCPIPATDWDYVSSSGNAIRLLPVGTPFQQGRLYEFTYPAKDPLVVGLGLRGHARRRGLPASRRDGR